MARRAMPIFPVRSPVARFTNLRHRFTLTRLPKPSVPVPGNLVPPGPVGVTPEALGPHHDSHAPVARDPVASPRPPDCSGGRSRSPLPTVPRRPGLTRRHRSYLLRTPTPPSPRLPGARSGGGRWICPVPTPLRLLPPGPPGRNPVPPKPLERALFGTGISKYPAKPQVKRYFRSHRVLHRTSSFSPGFPRPST